MKIRFYNDPETGQPHIYKHHVTEQEVVEVIYFQLEDRPGREDSRIMIGCAESGRYIKVVYVQEEDGIFVITAYELKGKPLSAYKRRRKRN